MTSAKWQPGMPALGMAIVKLIELHARMLRVEAARRAQRASALLALVKK